MTSLDTLSSFIEQRIADAEADLGPEAIGWIGMDAVNRARGRVSALREVEQKLSEIDRVGEADYPPIPMQGPDASPDLFAEQWIGKDMSPLEQWNADGNR